MTDQEDCGYSEESLENGTDQKGCLIHTFFWEVFRKYLMDHGIITQDEVNGVVAMLDTGSNCIIPQKISTNQKHYRVDKDTLDTKKGNFS